MKLAVKSRRQALLIGCVAVALLGSTFDICLNVLTLALVVLAVWYLARLLAFAETTGKAHEHQALHDPLTGLPNRAYLTRHLSHVLSDGAAAVMLVDLDGFKAVNDTVGHEAGDTLLVEIGGRLRAVVAPQQFIARLGGDEFVVVPQVV